MSDCCSTKNADSKETSQSQFCPNCQEKGKLVDIVTLKSLLVPDAMKRINPDHSYQFCRTTDCPVVYFNIASSFSKDDLTVEVFQKGSADTTPTCYCFGYNRKQINDDVIKNGKSTIQDEIKKYVKDKKCACEIRNPQGSCCLGNINQVIKEVVRG
ncbi:MAG: (2Fe-2S)-binding protein [Candidatus Omnitrophica bacterium]|nr:(2Fe-2S)-binding protein [Candidatus Omnitrophota bacterium]